MPPGRRAWDRLRPRRAQGAPPQAHFAALDHSAQEKPAAEQEAAAQSSDGLGTLRGPAAEIPRRCLGCRR
ncbi:hypothetical protein CW362_03720 [Streptomyces populi]|uniref:Uncharacterized protein n=1 Tax=Streptomyces populi TaxID=2058924 RepID=A0A2I0SWT3_9ACTN|nr:hypothetical protein CW362_03720 [Streptomyces populi]